MNGCGGKKWCPGAELTRSAPGVRTRGPRSAPTRVFSVQITPSLWACTLKNLNYFFNRIFVLVPHPNLSRNCRPVILPKLAPNIRVPHDNSEYAQRVMETELDPNLPNRTRTLAARFDHLNSSSIVTPAGLTLPEFGPPGKHAREWPGVAPWG